GTPGPPWVTAELARSASSAGGNYVPPGQGPRPDARNRRLRLRGLAGTARLDPRTSTREARLHCPGTAAAAVPATRFPWSNGMSHRGCAVRLAGAARRRRIPGTGGTTRGRRRRPDPGGFGPAGSPNPGETQYKQVEHDCDVSRTESQLGAEQRSRVLVTGGSGFIGRRLVTALLGSGAEVTVADRHEPA